MPIDPEFLANLKPGVDINLSDVPGFGEAEQEILRNSINAAVKNVNINPTDVVMNFVANIDWYNPFLLILYAIYALLTFYIIKKHASFLTQICLFIMIYTISMFVEPINDFLKDYHTIFYTKNPFDRDYLFVALIITVPASLFMMFIGLVCVLQCCYLLYKYIRAEKEDVGQLKSAKGNMNINSQSNNHNHQKGHKHKGPHNKGKSSKSD